MIRREFIKTTAASAVAASIFPGFIFKKSEKVYTTALIGTGWWGMNILHEAIAAGRSNVVALCDVDMNQMKPAADEVEKLTGKRPKLYGDYREMLASEKPEICIVATPDHWHALCAIEALKTGCNVYMEKPISHTIDEGKAIVAAQKKYGGTLQVGLHRRVSPHNVSGMKFLKSGKAGDIKLVKAFVDYGTQQDKHVPDSPVPQGLDWDFWCGPAPYTPFNTAIHPKGFRNYLDYANGTIADWGVHWFDQILWWSEEQQPKTIYSTGGQLYENEQFDAPDYQVANFEFDSFTATWEHRRLANSRNENHNLGVYFYGTEGLFHMGWLDGWTFYPNNKNSSIIHQDPVLHKPDEQNIKELWADLIDCIEKKQQTIANIQSSYYATNMSLLAMISYKRGKSISWDRDKQVIIDDPQANDLMRRTYRGPWKYPEV